MSEPSTRFPQTSLTFTPLDNKRIIDFDDNTEADGNGKMPDNIGDVVDLTYHQSK